MKEGDINILNDEIMKFSFFNIRLVVIEICWKVKYVFLNILKIYFLL